MGTITNELNDTLPRFNEQCDKSIDELAKAICEANSIYIIGLRSAKCLAIYLDYYLSWFFPNTQIPNAENILNYANAAPNGSLFIGISFPRYTRKTVNILEYVHKNGFKTAAITDSFESPLASCADITIASPFTQVAHIDSLVTPMGVINSLLLKITDNLGDSAIKMLKKLEYIWEANETYLLR